MLGEHQAGSATQDVFVRAWRDRGRFDPSAASLGGWLMAIARDRVVDSTGQQVAAHGVGDSAPTESEVTQIGDRMLLADALRLLPKPSQTVVELAFVDGVTVGEIADRTSLPLATVTSEIDRGGRRLRHALMAAYS